MAELDLKTLETVLDKRFEKQAQIIVRGFANLEDRVAKLEKGIEEIKFEIQALSAKLTNYMELSDKRYLELKHNNLVVAKWVQKIADKTGVEIDLTEWEKF